MYIFGNKERENMPYMHGVSDRGSRGSVADSIDSIEKKRKEKRKGRNRFIIFTCHWCDARALSREMGICVVYVVFGYAWIEHGNNYALAETGTEWKELGKRLRILFLMIRGSFHKPFSCSSLFFCMSVPVSSFPCWLTGGCLSMVCLP